jgi:AraC-like DNA-binding protein
MLWKRHARAAIEAAATDGDDTMFAHAPCVTHTSTAAVAPSDLLSYWDSYNAAALVGLRTTSQSRAGLIARQTNAAVPTMRVADIAGNAHAVERSADLVGMFPKEAVFACHLARAAGVSVRHLNRLFAQEGTSLADHIWAQRTAMAHRDLMHPRAPRRHRRDRVPLGLFQPGPLLPGDRGGVRRAAVGIEKECLI